MLYFFSLSGRYGRTAFWLTWLLCVGLTIVAALLSFDPSAQENGFHIQDAGDPKFWAATFLGMLAYVLSFSASIKRLHDRGKSGWWYLIIFIPVFGPLWAFIELGLLPGTGRDDNGYGPRHGLTGRIEKKTVAQEDRETFIKETRRRRATESSRPQDISAAEVTLRQRKEGIDRLHVDPSRRKGFGRRHYA